MQSVVGSERAASCHVESMSAAKDGRTAGAGLGQCWVPFWAGAVSGASKAGV